MNLDIEHLRQWIGKVETLHDVATLAPLHALAATLDRDDPVPLAGDAVPPCWHWLYFLPIVAMSGVGPDGHPRRGGFLPPVPLPRRMWAGSRISFLQPSRAGDTLARTSRIADVSAKQGRSGALVFVRVAHEIADSRGVVAITEAQDIVYRVMPQPGEVAPPAIAAGTDEQFGRRMTPDPVLLFRYSALTFNGHRILYDRGYAQNEEGYPGLVVHGPLVATLLIDLLRREHPAARAASYEFKAVSPLLDTAPFDLCGCVDGDRARLWARGAGGRLAMQASAVLAE